MLMAPSGESESQREPIRPPVWRLLVGAALMLIVMVTGLIVGGEAGAFISQSVRALPFVPLAVLAYYGQHFRWARVATVLWLAALVLAIAVMATGSALGALDPAVLESGLSIDPGDQVRIGLTALGMMAAAAVRLARFPAAGATVGGARASSGPRLVRAHDRLGDGDHPYAGELRSVDRDGRADADCRHLRHVGRRTDLDMGDGGATLRGELYGLVWIVVGAVFAVGLGVRRNLKQSLARLGLVSPTASQVGLAAALGLGLVVVVAVLGLGIEWLWGQMGWTVSGGAGFDEAFGTLLAPFLTPVGAVVLGLSAGLGEEVAVRGVLQPRLGILLSNLLFTALHAFQYNWDALLVVFLLGVVLGVIRRRTNTTTSVIVHGVYDFTLVVAMMTQIPLVGE